MRRLSLAVLFVLGLSWGLSPHAQTGAVAIGGQGLGAERAYLDAAGSGPPLTAQAPLLAAAPGLAGWGWPVSERLHTAPPVPAQRRRYLQWMRLQLEGG